MISLISTVETSQIQNTSISTSSDPFYWKDELQKEGGGVTNLFAIWKSVRHVDMSP